MHDQALTLPVLYLRTLADHLRSVGVAVGPWLGRNGLAEGQLADPSVTLDRAVFQGLVLDAMTLAREPALGLLVGERLGANTHGILGYAALNSGTIRQAMELVERYGRLRTTLVSTTQEHRPGEARVCFTEPQDLGETRRPILEAVVLSIKNILDAISFGHCRVDHVAFPFEAPGYAGLARDLFGCPVRYGQSWAGFALPPQVLDVPLRMADPEAFRTAAMICQRELDKLTVDASLAVRVRRLLLEKQSGFPSLQVAARQFHMTPRTLHRRLLDEGTSFRGLLEEVRHTLAVEHLRAGRFSIEEIAFTLGYSDLANFRRAFKRWESVAPSAYRKAVVKPLS